MKYEDLKKGKVYRLQFKDGNKNERYLWIVKMSNKLGIGIAGICTFPNTNVRPYYSCNPDFSSSLSNKEYEFTEADELETEWIEDCIKNKVGDDEKLIKPERVKNYIIENFEIY